MAPTTVEDFHATTEDVELAVSRLFHEVTNLSPRAASFIVTVIEIDVLGYTCCQ